MGQSDWCEDMFGDAFWIFVKHFRAFKPRKQLVLFGNIYGWHSEKWLYMPRLWVIFLPILPNNDESIPLTILHNIGTLSSKLVLLRFNFNILKSTLTNKDIHISILDIFLKCIRPSKLCIYWLFLPCFHLCWNLEPNQSDSSAK